MAKVSLRAYNHEIEGMIEGGQLDEAVAHCKYILKTFPMHVETYRLLGKAFLEGRHYADAADIFERVLMAVPDDFVAHVGMSIIRDDEGKLDDAIWHMERAFEVQPSNAAIQGEMRRLYGRRDGVEPPKIRLSRDALANMYSQGELYNQAIAEIRAVLGEDASRSDLQVMLARAYYHAGQKVEAAEMAATLLKKYSYCRDALRILVDVLPGTARAENTQVYRQRLRMIDPYSSFAADSVFASEQVPDTAVNIERLDYRPGAVPSGAQPDWASSLGIKLSGEKRGEVPPDWIGVAETGEQMPSLEAGASTGEGSDSIPEWMRSAGWQESSGQVQEEPMETGEETPAEPIARADIPDWLKSMAPAEMSNAAEEEPAQPIQPASEGGEDVPDWLQSITPAGSASGAEAETPTEETGTQPAAADAEPGESVEPPSESGGDVPDWLKSMEPQEETAAAGSEPPTEEAATGSASAGDEGQPESVEPPAAQASNLPDWLMKLGGEEPAKGPGEEELSQPEQLPAKMEAGAGEAHPTPEASAGVPVPPPEESQEVTQPVDVNAEEGATPVAPEASKLAEEATQPAMASSTEESEAPQSHGEARPLDIGDDALGWLESLAARQGAKAEELLTTPESRSEEMPDWLHPEEKQPPASAAEEPITTPRETLPLEMPELPVEKPAAEPVQKPSPLEEQPPVGKSPAEELPVEGTPFVQPVEQEPGQGGEDTIAWLEQLAAEEDEKAVVSPSQSEAQPKEEETPKPESASEAAEEDVTITSWLSKLDVEEATGKGTAPSGTEAATPSAAEELPDWLKDFEQPGAPAERPRAGEELPEWLRRPAEPPETKPIPSEGGAEETTEGQAVSKPAAPSGSSSASELQPPAWLDENAPVAERAEPTTPEEWIPAEGQPAGSETGAAEEETPSVPAAPQPEPSVQPPIIKGTGMLSRVPAQDKDAEPFSAAQAALEANSLDEAMKEYGKLVKKGRLLDEIIHDLREAIYRFPVDVIVWQTLGDAYMRANRLQDALDAYTKAEELLR